MSTTANVLLMPCEHKCICKPCSMMIFQKFKSCPVCRAPIERMDNIIFKMKPIKINLDEKGNASEM